MAPQHSPTETPPWQSPWPAAPQGHKPGPHWPPLQRFISQTNTWLSSPRLWVLLALHKGRLVGVLTPAGSCGVGHSPFEQTGWQQGEQSNTSPTGLVPSQDTGGLMPAGSPKVPREARGSSRRWCLHEHPQKQRRATAGAAAVGLLLYPSFETEPRAEPSPASIGQMESVTKGI